MPVATINSRKSINTGVESYIRRFQLKFKKVPQTLGQISDMIYAIFARILTLLWTVDIGEDDRVQLSLTTRNGDGRPFFY